ncbi:MAG: NnrU family protein [Pseudomonadota bacterium]
MSLLPAAVLFLATHLGLSSTPLRGRLVVVLGERGFLAFYSLIAIGTLSYLIWLYNDLPRFEYLWTPSPELYLAAKLLMPLALILAVGSFLVKNPTMVGAERLLEAGPDGDGGEPARGVIRITRHPFQWGALIWAVAHMLANGDSHSVVFFSSFLLLSGLGTVLMDQRKAAALGGRWTAYAAVTSNLPFAAILAGRNRLVLRELILPVALGLLLYAGLYYGHQWVGGVRLY